MKDVGEEVEGDCVGAEVGKVGDTEGIDVGDADGITVLFDPPAKPLGEEGLMGWI